MISFSEAFLKETVDIISKIVSIEIEKRRLDSRGRAMGGGLFILGIAA